MNNIVYNIFYNVCLRFSISKSLTLKKQTLIRLMATLSKLSGPLNYFKNNFNFLRNKVIILSRVLD